MKPEPETPSESVAKLSYEALLGTLKMGIPQGIALAKVYAKYKENPAQRREALQHFAKLLATHAPDVAAQLVDALVERVGR